MQENQGVIMLSTVYNEKRSPAGRPQQMVTIKMSGNVSYHPSSML